jgi:hypothetical protein
MAKGEQAGGKPDKASRSLHDRAMASMRSASRTMRDVSEPEARAKYMLAEANVLARLDLADAIRGSAANSKG